VCVSLCVCVCGGGGGGMTNTPSLPLRESFFVQCTDRFSKIAECLGLRQVQLFGFVVSNHPREHRVSACARASVSMSESVSKFRMLHRLTHKRHRTSQAEKIRSLKVYRQGNTGMPAMRGSATQGQRGSASRERRSTRRVPATTSSATRAHA
jgi:hypothetical protein